MYDVFQAVYSFSSPSKNGGVSGSYNPEENEPLRSYLERFNKEAVQVATNDNMKKYLIERGLRRHSNFAKAIGIEPQATLEDLLHKAQAYIACEEKDAVINIRNPQAASSSGHNRGSSRGGGY
jgi:hypothetical protein